MAARPVVHPTSHLPVRNYLTPAAAARLTWGRSLTKEQRRRKVGSNSSCRLHASRTPVEDLGAVLPDGHGPAIISPEPTLKLLRDVNVHRFEKILLQVCIVALLCVGRPVLLNSFIFSRIIFIDVMELLKNDLSKYSKASDKLLDELHERFSLPKLCALFGPAGLLILVEQPALAVTGAAEDDLIWTLISAGIIAFWYFLVMPPIIFNWLRLRWYKRKLLELYVQFMCVFIFFPGLMLWAPLLNFRQMPRDPSMKYPWSTPVSSSMKDTSS